MSNIRIDIASEFKDKGFKQADKATTGLDKTLKNLGKTLVAVFSVQQVTAFAKASVKAFAEDEKAATRLSTTLNNLGLAFEDPRVKTFLANLESTTGVLDDQLRPAFESLIRTTSSATKSQELLALAIDIAAGSGVDLQTVANDLSKAYLGNTRGLTKYNTGLTKAELQASNFYDIQKLLTQQYAGQNAKYLETYAGKVSLLNVAYANMQETIGKGLVDSFTLLAGDSGIAGLTKAMEDFSMQVADVIRGVAILADKLKNLPGLDRIPILDVGNIPVVGAWLKILQGLGENQRKMQSVSKFRPNYADTFAETAGRTSAANKETARIKREKELAALQKKAAAAAAKAEKERLKREKEAAALKRAGTVFDMENIQIVAALQGKVTEEQRLRLTALFAIQNDNAKAAEALTLAILASNKAAFEALGVTFQAGDTVETLISKIIKAQANLFLINTGIDSIKDAKNPFKDWPDIIAALLAQISQLQNAINNIGAPTLPIPGTTPGGTPGYDAVPAMVQPGSGVTFGNQGNPLIVPIGTSPEVFDNPAMTLPGFDNKLVNPDLNWSKQGDTYVTNVTVGGSVISDADLVDLIQQEIYNAQKSGGATQWNYAEL